MNVNDFAGIRVENAQLREENIRLRVEREKFLGKWEHYQEQSERAEARLREVVEALTRVLVEAGMQAHKHGCPNRLTRPARWDEFKPCAGCEAEAALAAAQPGGSHE